MTQTDIDHIFDMLRIMNNEVAIQHGAKPIPAQALAGKDSGQSTLTLREYLLRSSAMSSDECYVCGGRCWVVKFGKSLCCPRCNSEADVPDCGPEEDE